MGKPDKTAPPSPDPKSGHNPGYAEPQPRDREDAQKPDPREKPNPDEGGLDRDATTDPDPAADD